MGPVLPKKSKALILLSKSSGVAVKSTFQHRLINCREDLGLTHPSDLDLDVEKMTINLTTTGIKLGCCGFIVGVVDIFHNRLSLLLWAVKFLTSRFSLI